MAKGQGADVSASGWRRSSAGGGMLAVLPDPVPGPEGRAYGPWCGDDVGRAS